MKVKMTISPIVLVMVIITCLFVQPVFAAGTAPAQTFSRMSASLINAHSITPEITETGKISWSIDGLGVYPGTTGTIQVEKPAGATVRSAYMFAATMGISGYQLAPGDILIDGAPVIWSSPPSPVQTHPPLNSYNYMADVTSIVKSKIDAAPAGRVDFTITETPALQTDGEILVVIFDDPAQTTDNTVVLLFGTEEQTGDNFKIVLGKPIDLNDPNLALDFSLGISYSYQESDLSDHQSSLVDVNSKRMTSWAGGNDDGITDPANGNLLTVGGLDDSNANPADPNAQPQGNRRYDDELYSLLPFVANGDTQIQVHTQNPTMDDNIFFAGLFARSITAEINPLRTPEFPSLALPAVMIIGLLGAVLFIQRTKEH